MPQYRRSPRAEFLNYDDGCYFVTICTRNRQHYFGRITNGEMQLSEIGVFITEQLIAASDYCSDVAVKSFVVMPNHVHAIICIDRRDVPLARLKQDSRQRCPNPSLRGDPTCQRHVPTLSRYISSLKGAVTKFARSHALEFGWQERYHDHLIRGNHDGKLIMEYISRNVDEWQKDCLYNQP